MINGDPQSQLEVPQTLWQDFVALSTSEVECMTTSEGDQEVVQILDILQDFGFTQKGSTILYVEPCIFLMGLFLIWALPNSAISS